MVSWPRSLLLTPAVSSLPLTKVVSRSFPFQDTVEARTKLEPNIESVNESPPTTPKGGLKQLISGAGLLICTLDELETAPWGLKTETLPLPESSRSETSSRVRYCLLLIKVVGRSTPFQRTVESGVKLEPMTVTSGPAAPAVSVSRLRLLMEGCELSASSTTPKTFSAIWSTPPLAEWILEQLGEKRVELHITRNPERNAARSYSISIFP